MNIKKLIVVSGLLLTTSSAISADWRMVYTNPDPDGASISIDRDSMSYNKYLKEAVIWKKYTKRNGTVATQNVEIDCVKHAARIITSIYILPGTEDPITQSNKYSQWENLIPETIGYLIADVVCENLKNE